MTSVKSLPDRESRTALVTGAVGTLGTAIVRRLLEAGIRVGVTDVDAPAVDEAASLLTEEFGSGSAIGAPADLKDLSSLNDMVDEIGSRFGRLDILVNNAALNRNTPFDDLNEADWDGMAAVDLRAPAFLAKAVKPFWSAQREGCIVNLGSRTWLSGGPVAYVSLKAGIVGLTRALAAELGPLGVRANAVAPSFIRSDFTSAGRTPQELEAYARSHAALSPLGETPAAEDVANAVAFLASDQASCITGEVLHVCGGAQMAPRA